MITINIPVEKDYFITPQQTYDIISAAIEDAYDNGFINKYVFYRSMLVHTYITLEEPDEVLASEKHLQAHLSPLEYWYDNLEAITAMLEKYDTSYLEDIASSWIEDYTQYAYSLRGLLDNISELADSMMNRSEVDYAQLANNSDIQNALQIAKDWGMNRTVEDAIVVEEKTAKAIPVDSLMTS